MVTLKPSGGSGQPSACLHRVWFHRMIWSTSRRSEISRTYSSLRKGHERCKRKVGLSNLATSWRSLAIFSHSVWACDAIFLLISTDWHSSFPPSGNIGPLQKDKIHICKFSEHWLVLLLHQIHNRKKHGLNKQKRDVPIIMKTGISMCTPDGLIIISGLMPMERRNPHWFWIFLTKPAYVDPIIKECTLIWALLIVSYPQMAPNSSYTTGCWKYLYLGKYSASLSLIYAFHYLSLRSERIDSSWSFSFYRIAVIFDTIFTVLEWK